MAVPCGKTKFFSTGAIKGYALPSRKRLIHHWNPPPKVNFVPNTLYSAKMRKKMPTAMRRAASARALRSFTEEAEEGVSIVVLLRQKSLPPRPFGARRRTPASSHEARATRRRANCVGQAEQLPRAVPQALAVKERGDRGPRAARASNLHTPACRSAPLPSGCPTGSASAAGAFGRRVRASAPAPIQALLRSLR